MSLISESRAAREVLELRRSRLWRGEGAPAGDGSPVVLVAGFGMRPETMRPLGRWLRSGGWRVVIAPTGWNVGCGEQTAAALLDVVRTTAADTGEPVAIVGHSRGGQLARVGAVREPALFSRVVTVNTPWSVGPPATPGVRAATRAVRSLRARGVDVLASVECGDGPCCAAYRADLTRVPLEWSALWSRRDTVAGNDGRPPAGPATTVDTGTTHVGAIASMPGWLAIGAALAR